MLVLRKDEMAAGLARGEQESSAWEQRLGARACARLPPAPRFWRSSRVRREKREARERQKAEQEAQAARRLEAARQRVREAYGDGAQQPGQQRGGSAGAAAAEAAAVAAAVAASAEGGVVDLAAAEADGKRQEQQHGMPNVEIEDI